MDNAQSLLHAADSLGQFLGPHVFQQISQGPSFHSAPQISSTGKGGEDDDARGQMTTFQFRSGIEAGHQRHFDVSDENVRLVGYNGLNSLFAVANLSNDRDVAFDLEEGGKRAKNHALIFGQNHADGLAILFCDRIQLTALPDFGETLSGTAMMIFVPSS